MVTFTDRSRLADGRFRTARRLVTVLVMDTMMDASLAALQMVAATIGDGMVLDSVLVDT